MCDLDYNEETHMCGNCDVHDVDAAAVIGKINAIGTVELTPESKAKIDSAAAAFKSLSDEQQALVGNFNTLRAAQAEYKQLKNQEDKRKANLVIAGINNLGTISFSSESNEKIAIAKKMYASLTADQKALVTNYDVLEAAIARYDELKQEAYDQAAADDVIGRISAIGTVTYSDASALKISRARNDYNALTNTQKALVTNYSVLTAAEAKYAQLQAAANQTAADKAAVENAVQKINAIGKVEYTSDCKVKIDEARNTYNALTATQKALVTNYAVLTEAEAKYAEMEALHEAIDAINAIGAVGFTTECKAKIDAARNAYNALSDAQKAQITNYKTLTAAEAEYAKLKAAADLAAADQAAADAVIAKIGAIGTVDNTDASKAKIDVARNAYNALSYKQKSLVTNFNLLTAAETKYAQMKKSVEDKAAADSASAKISAIGTVEYSAESKKKINDAAVAYNALTAEQKALVDNHATLAAAQAKYDELKAAAENPESPTPISELSATVTAPVGGEHPSFTVTVPDGAHYTAVVDTWYDLGNNGAHLTNSDTFVTGNEYQARIHFTANTGYEIANSASYTINGTPNYTAFDTAEQRGMNFVATVPAVTTYTVSGSVTSFNDASGDVTLQLILEGLSEPAYETTVKGNTVAYSFADVAAGTYTMKVSKANHVTREYTVFVGNSPIPLDAKIHLLGDINGDGKVTTIDFGRANSHAKGVAILTGYELLCVDTVKQDGLVTTADAGRVNAHARGTSLLW